MVHSKKKKVFLKNSNVEVLTPSTSECDLEFGHIEDVIS